MADHVPGQFCRRTRREFLWEAGAGFTGLALTGLLSADGFFNRAAAADARPANPLAPKPPHFSPKAKSVIFLFMYGGPSQVDTFDYKPKLYELDGKTIPVKTFGRSGRKNQGRVVGPKWQFKRYGRCGKMISDLFPHLATCVDDIAFLHSMTADSPIHGSAMLQMNTGRILSGSPCLGSWVNYGLGSVNSNIPGFVVMLDPTGGPISGAKNWSSGYMPAQYQGVILRSAGEPILDLKPPAGMTPAMQRRLLHPLGDHNPHHPAPPPRRRPHPPPNPPRRHAPRHAAAAARHARRLQPRPPRAAPRQLRARRPHRQLRDGVQHAAARAGSRRPFAGVRGDQVALRHGQP